MTVANDSTATLPAATSLVAKAPPKYALGATVVLKGYEDGWRWTVVDAGLLRRKAPFWSYTVSTFRPYDGKLVYSQWPEWKLRPAPEAVA